MPESLSFTSSEVYHLIFLEAFITPYFRFIPMKITSFSLNYEYPKDSNYIFNAGISYTPAYSLVYCEQLLNVWQLYRNSTSRKVSLGKSYKMHNDTYLRMHQRITYKLEINIPNKSWTNYGHQLSNILCHKPIMMVYILQNCWRTVFLMNY